MNTLERAATAVCEARCDPERPDPGKGLDEHIALAVLKAIREPDEGMMHAARMADEQGRPPWQAMIDHIITEGEGKTG